MLHDTLWNKFNGRNALKDHKKFYIYIKPTTYQKTTLKLLQFPIIVVVKSLSFLTGVRFHYIQGNVTTTKHTLNSNIYHSRCSQMQDKNKTCLE